MAIYQVRADVNSYCLITPAAPIESSGDVSDILAYDEQFFDDSPLAPTWATPSVAYVDTEGVIGDFPGFGPTPVFSGRAVDVLRDLLEPNGELLPTNCPTHAIWFYKVLRFLDIMDWEKADVAWWPETRVTRGKPRRAQKVRRFAIRDDRPPDPGIFKMPSLPFWYIFVNEEFHRRVREADLLGFQFTQIWPTPDDSAARKRFLEKHRRKTGRRGRNSS